MDPEDLRASIPALDGTVYLNAGAGGPSPRRVVDAVESELEDHEYESGLVTIDVEDPKRPSNVWPKRTS